MWRSINNYLSRTYSLAPLAVFRIGFGIMMLYSIIRFWTHGWIDTVYIQPQFHFKYYGLAWVPHLGDYTYLLFIICAMASLLIALGSFYRAASIIFFLFFTWIELLDKTTYLNHYYFISVLSLLLIFLPANKYFSLDVYYQRIKLSKISARWHTDSIKLLLGIVYFYAGLSKINSDWLLKALPLKIWLPSKYDLPILGADVMQQEWFHYAMSWGGMLYDLTIPFLLLYKKTRWVAFALVVFFHVFTRVLFPIGMFPFIMIVCALIFFDPSIHRRLLAAVTIILKKIGVIKMFKIFALSRKRNKHKPAAQRQPIYYSKIALLAVALLLIIQIVLPWRYLAYDGELFWTEQGYRYSWRVMLMEKVGYTQFKIVKSDGSQFYVDNTDFLTSYQEKQMSFQPDFILEYAHYLGDYFTAAGEDDVAVYVESYVALNGRSSQRFIDPAVDLYKIDDTFAPKTWVLPFSDTISGL